MWTIGYYDRLCQGWREERYPFYWMTLVRSWFVPSSIIWEDTPAVSLRGATKRIAELETERQTLREALSICRETLLNTREFMLKKHGTTNQAREQALQIASDLLDRE